MTIATQTEAFYLAYNEVRMAVEVSGMHADKANHLGAVKAAAYGARKAQEAMAIAGELVGKVEIDFLSYAREMTALNEVSTPRSRTSSWLSVSSKPRPTPPRYGPES